METPIYVVNAFYSCLLCGLNGFVLHTSGTQHVSPQSIVTLQTPPIEKYIHVVIGVKYIYAIQHVWTYMYMVQRPLYKMTQITMFFSQNAVLFPE